MAAGSVVIETEDGLSLSTFGGFSTFFSGRTGNGATLSGTMIFISRIGASVAGVSMP